MQHKSIAVGAALLLGFVASSAQAQVTATQSVSYEVATVNELSVSGDPGALMLSTVDAGGALVDDTDASTTYTVTTNAATWEITAAIDVAMPTGLQLDVLLAAPGASSTSATTTLTTTATAVVSNGTGALSSTGNTITYTLSAPSGVATAQTGTRTVTFTLVPLT